MGFEIDDIAETKEAIKENLKELKCNLDDLFKIVSMLDKENNKLLEKQLKLEEAKKKNQVKRNE